MNEQLRIGSRAIVVAAVGAILVWLVISQSLAAYLAPIAPKSALWLNSRQPDALTNLADLTLNGPAATSGSPNDTESGQKTVVDGEGDVNNGNNSRNIDRAFRTIDQNRSVDLPTVREWARSALLNDPLNARGLRILGQAADVANKDQDAHGFMEAAARLSLHETAAAYWLMRKDAEAGQYQEALYYADVILRTRPALNTYVVPILARLAEDKRSAQLLRTLLNGNPPWRSDFLKSLPDNVTDARTPLEVLLALRTNPAPPTASDIEPYLQLLIKHHLYDLAYYTWLQFLSPSELRAAGLLFNGRFDIPPSGLPFNWQISAGSGVDVDIVPQSEKDGGNALLINFLYGRVDYHSVTELVMLSPGSYQFKGEYKGNLEGPRGMKWRMACASGPVIGESAMIGGANSNWKDVEFTFTVPPDNCRAQYVRLDLDSRMQSEQLVSGSMLFGDLQISRMPGSPS